MNGIEVDLSVSEFPPAGCQAFTSVTESFDPLDPKILIHASASVPPPKSLLLGVKGVK